MIETSTLSAIIQYGTHVIQRKFIGNVNRDKLKIEIEILS